MSREGSSSYIDKNQKLYYPECIKNTQTKKKKENKMSLTNKVAKTVSSNWISISLSMIVITGLGITVLGQFGLDLSLSNNSNQSAITQNNLSNNQISAKSLETIQIAATGAKIQTIKDQYTRSEKIEANGTEIKILDFNKFLYTSSVNQAQEVYCAVGIEIINQSDSEIKVLPDFDFELIDGSPSGGILLTSPLVKSIDSKPALELVEFETFKLEPKKSFSKTIPFVCQENSEYQFIVKTTQFQNKTMFKVVNIKLV